MQEFKPCPFCGGKDIFLKYNGSNHGRFYYVECETCGGRTKGICRPWREIDEDNDPYEWDCQQAMTVKRLWERRSVDA
jgi:hypothetical protein